MMCCQDRWKDWMPWPGTSLLLLIVGPLAGLMARSVTARLHSFMEFGTRVLWLMSLMQLLALYEWLHHLLAQSSFWGTWACYVIHLVCTRRGKCQILHPLQMLSKHSARLSPLWMTIPQMLRSSQRRKPQPMVQVVPFPKKLLNSTHTILEGLSRLQRSIQAINPSFIKFVCLQACRTSVVENLHAVTKMKHPTPTVLEHARSFGHAMHERIKQMSLTLWSVKYYTHPTS